MSVERVPGGASLIDVLDRILDKGIVVDAWARISLAGINLRAREARLAVAQVETCLEHAATPAAEAGGTARRARRRK